jgi:hypothetical protein
MTVKGIWKDPVGAAVIAGIVLAAFTWGWGKLPSSNPEFITHSIAIPLWLIIIAVSGLLGALWKLLSQHETTLRETYNFESKLTLISMTVTLSPPAEKRTYPLKCSVFLRNESKGCIDVLLLRYEQEKVPMKIFRQGVLQIEVSTGWVPTDHGVDRIAVLPDENVRAWIPIDENKYTTDEINGARGQIGTLVFKVNGKEERIKI